MWSWLNILGVVSGILVAFALVILSLDNYLYPGNPGTNPSAVPPEFMVVLRDVAFFLLTILAILWFLWVFFKERGEWSRKITFFVGLNALFFLACWVYMFVYRYELSANAQAGSEASNFYYAAIGYLGLVLLLFAGGACYSNPWSCNDVLNTILVIMMAFH